MSRRLRQLKQDWEDLGEIDAMWAVLSQPEFQHRRGSTPAFFATGAAEVEHILQRAGLFQLPESRHRCLDVGSGLGRITRALASSFDGVVGVDISEAMVTGAQELNSDLRNCSFTLNDGESLGHFDSETFDLVNASIMLQHLSSSKAISRYIDEFVRVLVPGGIAIFQLPVRIPLFNRLQLRRKSFHILRSLGVSSRLLFEQMHCNPIQMRALSPADVARAVAESSALLLLAECNIDAAPIITPRYYITKGI